jgi:Fe-S oxidoreductase
VRQFSDDIDTATAYCTYCPKLCRFSCPASEAEKRETVTPWGMMRLFEVAKDGSLELDASVAETFYHCTGCRRCQNWCKHDNDVPEALWAARDWVHSEGLAPEAATEVTAQFDEHGGPFDTPAPPLEDASPPRLDEVFDPDSSVVFVPDCTTRWEHPERIAAIGVLLARLNEGEPVALATLGSSDGDGRGCCGAPLAAAGDGAGWRRWRSGLETDLEDAELVVTDCPSMAAHFTDGTSWGKQRSLPVEHLVAYLDRRLEDVTPPQPVSLQAPMVHDACLLTRQVELADQTRRVLDALVEESIAEFDFNRKEAPCCGAAGLYDRVAPEAASRCAGSRITDLRKEGGQTVVCGSTDCSKALAEQTEAGESALDIVELALRAFAIGPSESSIGDRGEE